MSDLLLWRDPKKSAAVFVSIVTLFAGIKYSQVSFVALFAYVAIAAIVAFNAYSFYAKLTHKAPAAIPSVVANGLSDEEARDAASAAVPCANKALGFVYALLTGQAPGLIALTVLGLYVAAKLSYVVTVPTIVLVATLLAFSLPKLYELRKDEVDAHVDAVRSKATAVYDQHVHPLIQKIPRGKAAKTTVEVPVPAEAPVSRTIPEGPLAASAGSVTEPVLVQPVPSEIKKDL